MLKSLILCFLSFTGVMVTQAPVETAIAASGNSDSRDVREDEYIGPEFTENLGSADNAGSMQSSVLPNNRAANAIPGAALPSEERYVAAIRAWLDSLQPEQRQRVRRILREAHPELHALRLAIRDKKAELAAIRFGRDTKPETLPRIGQELQALRATLREELQKVGDRLHDEAGITMGPLGDDGFWLVTPQDRKPSLNSPESDDGLANPLAYYFSLGEIRHMLTGSSSVHIN